jgi:CheY-like chemotaxis protein
MNQIVMLKDGQEAISYLFDELTSEEYLRNPMVVLLDLNMPVLDGYQVLRRLKADHRTKHIPVIVLTTADDTQAVLRCYELGCNMFVSKRRLSTVQ